MIKYIWVNTWTEFTSNLEKNNQQYLEVDRLNIFIGRNNSGKSRLIRNLFSAKHENILWENADDKVDELLSDLTIMTGVIPQGAFYGVFHGVNIRHYINKQFLFGINDRAEFLKMGNEIPAILQGAQRQSSGDVIHAALQGTVREYQRVKGRQMFTNLMPEKPVHKRIYIPILRGMRPLSFQQNNNVYLDRTKQDYFKVEDDSIKENIVTGENLYKLLTENLLGEPIQRERIKRYERLLSENFFEGKNISLIPKHDHDVVNIFIEGENQRPIYDLGDGLQQIIVITAAAYLADQESIILIEEPENSLHPGLLRQLIKFLLNHTVHQYMVTTHSNHILEFADECEDCITYKLQKLVAEDEVKFHITKTNSNRNLLIDLGVKSSSIYLANCTVWVEGITDRLYIREFLKKYISTLNKESSDYKIYTKYIENYHYSFVEYQGGNLTHWSFSEQNDEAIQELRALSVTTNALLIADGDIDNKGDRVAKLKDQLGDKFYLLKAKEIENLIPVDVLKSVASELFESFKRNKYGKKISQIEDIEYSHYSSSPQGVGFHIDQALGLSGVGNDVPLIFASESGTIKDKSKFCEKAVSYMQSNDWQLTDEIEDLCKKIMVHIKTNNEI